MYKTLGSDFIFFRNVKAPDNKYVAKLHVKKPDNKVLLQPLTLMGKLSKLVPMNYTSHWERVKAICTYNLNVKNKKCVHQISSIMDHFDTKHWLTNTLDMISSPWAGWSDLEYYLTTQQNAWNRTSYFAWFPTNKEKQNENPENVGRTSLPFRGLEKEKSQNRSQNKELLFNK